MRKASAPGEEPGVRVVPFDGSDSEWDSLLSGFPESTFCHLGGWRGVFEQVFRHESFYHVAWGPQGDVLGLLPLTRVRSRLFGDYLLSMPFLSYGGPLGTDAAQAALVENAIGVAKRLGVDLLELRSRRPISGDLSVSDRKITVLLDLPDTAEELWETGLRSKVRSQIRRPMKEGMEARFGEDQLGPFYEVFSRTMRDLGTPVLPKRFFFALAANFPGQVHVCAVWYRGRPVAAGCGFLWNQEFELTWAGALREHSRLAPNMLLYWSLMEKSMDEDARVFNFGRCTPGSGTHKFKSQWGGRDLPLPWAQWTAKGIASTPNPEGSRYRLAVALWRRLPITLANRIGPVLSGGLP